MNKFLLIASLILFLFSCKTYTDEDKKSFDQQIKTYLKKNGLDYERSESGLYFQIIEPGEGKLIRYQDVVSFTYKGSFLSGEVFDKQAKPVEFNVKDLIGAWKEIMLELKPGAKANLVAPPQLAYGDKNLDDIPVNSILVYELEIIEVK